MASDSAARVRQNVMPIDDPKRAGLTTTGSPISFSTRSSHASSFPPHSDSRTATHSTTGMS